MPLSISFDEQKLEIFCGGSLCNNSRPVELLAPSSVAFGGGSRQWLAGYVVLAIDDRHR